jgi:hypothetical protein
MSSTTSTVTALVVPSPGRQFDRWDLDPWEWHIGRRREAPLAFGRPVYGARLFDRKIVELPEVREFEYSFGTPQCPSV